jgi:ABC-type polar amino acid transport system ATPase subunit
MDAGRILEIAAPAEFFASPRHERARSFLSKLSGVASLAR